MMVAKVGDWLTPEVVLRMKVSDPIDSLLQTLIDRFDLDVSDEQYDEMHESVFVAIEQYVNGQQS
jgi:hypothetical protein